MTRYRKLKKQPVMPRESSKCSVFAGICAVLMMSCALAGLAMSAKGAGFATINLVDHEGQYKWRVQDRDVDPATTSTWTIRKPVVTDDGGLSFTLNTLSTKELVSDLYTVYMVWYGELDMTGAETITAEISIACTGPTPTLVCRDGDEPYTAWSYVDSAGNVVYYEPFVRLHFLTSTGDSWDCHDYWWSNGEDGAEFAYLGFNTGKKVMSWTLTASLTDLLSWSDRDGHMAEYHSDMFADSLSDVRMIGLSFGGNTLFANGVAVLGSTGASTVTFELQNYVIA